MSDLETRLTEALRAESEEAPDALGLADAARTRARARRRTRAAAVGLAAVAALAIPVAVVAFGGGGDDGKAPVADDSAGADALPEGRWESWHGVTVRVPEDWEYGDQSTWCADGGSVETFRITRPGGAVRSIACTPGSSYGLSFQEIEMDETDEPFDWPVVTQTGDAWPPDTYVGARGEAGVLVTVAGPDREELLEILGTVRTVDGVDPNGCPVLAGNEPTAAGQMSVCRYDPMGRLVQSELLSEGDTELASSAIAAAPRDNYRPPCPGGAGERLGSIEMRETNTIASIVIDSVCEGMNKMTIDGKTYALSEEILYWALSPGWSGSGEGNVPLPEQLRQRD